MWKKAVSLFVTFDETKPVETTNTKDIVDVKATTVPAPIYSGSINSEMAEMLANAIKEADQDGFDYLEFSESLANDAFKVLPEQSKFAAVFAVAKASGLTVPKLIASVEHYQSVLNNQKQQFDAHVQQRIADELSVRENKKALNEKSIYEAQQKIVELTQSITMLQQENIQLTSEISQEDLNIKNTVSSFESTFNVVYTKLEDDKTKIKTYIGAP
jgi:hypothetical protein